MVPVRFVGSGNGRRRGDLSLPAEGIARKVAGPPYRGPTMTQRRPLVRFGIRRGRARAILFSGASV